MKKNIRTVLVAVDLSKYSKLVVREAQQLAVRWRAKIKYIYVVDDSDRLKRKHANELIGIYRKQVQDFYKNLDQKDLTVLCGKPGHEIIRYSKTLDRPMIVVGHRGFNPLYQMFLGSVAESVALSAPCPVWIHRGPKIVFPERILIPSDLSDQANRTLKGLRSFQKPKKLELFYVSKMPTVGTDSPDWPIVYEKLKQAEVSRIKEFRKIYPDLKTAETIGGGAARIQEEAKYFDIIALAPKDRNHGLPLLGSVTARLVRSGRKPVVIFP